MAVVLTHDEVWPPLTRYWHSRKVFRKAAPALVTTAAYIPSSVPHMKPMGPDGFLMPVRDLDNLHTESIIK